MRLVQLRNGNERRVAIVEEPQLRLLDGVSSVYALAQAAIRDRVKLTDLAEQSGRRELLPYDEIYSGDSEWKLLTPIDHPVDPARCLVSGTGLTHLGSAKNRQSMHEIAEADVDGQHENVPVGHRERAGRRRTQLGSRRSGFTKARDPRCARTTSRSKYRRTPKMAAKRRKSPGFISLGPTASRDASGFAGGNEFSDHQFEKKNYLNLAGSKLRQCSLGPELVVDTAFESVNVDVAHRAGRESVLVEVVFVRRTRHVSQPAKS